MRSGNAATENPYYGVDTTHLEFATANLQWSRIRDCLAGSDAVKSGGKAYLPTLAGHGTRPDLARTYAERAMFVNFAGRTVDALTGAIFRKEGGIKVPGRYQPRLANINNAGDPLYTFAKKVTREVISYGRFGLLVDTGLGSGDGNDPLEFLPYMAGYSAQSITNWRSRNVRGRMVLDQVILKESRSESLEFGSRDRPVYRVLELDENGWYRCRVIESHNDHWITVAEIYPTDAGGQMLEHIPFVFINPVDLSPTVRRSPILDLVDVNLSHYRTSADLEQGRFFTSQPTPVIMGVGEDQQDIFSEMTIGSGNLWLLPPSVTEVKMLEYTGDGLGSLERALAEKERYMAQLGARLLEEPKRAAEAAETVRLRNAGETSTLASIARTVADGIRTAMGISCEWAGIKTSGGRGGEGGIEFELNQDFVDASMDPAMLAQLVGTYQAGLMPMADFHWNLQRGEMLRPGSTLEDFQDALEVEPPTFSRMSLRLADEAVAERKPE